MILRKLLQKPIPANPGTDVSDRIPPRVAPRPAVSRTLAVLFTATLAATAQQTPSVPLQLPTHAPDLSRNKNQPAEVEKFRDRGLGLFIHWSVDGALGGVISHSLVGASPDYVERFYKVLPGQFNPVRYRPEEWAALAKLAGFEYVMFTAKHHAGFCMCDTAPHDLS